MMRKPIQPLDTIIDELDELGCKKMAIELEEQFNSPDFLTVDRIELIRRIVEPEYTSCIDDITHRSARFDRARCRP